MSIRRFVIDCLALTRNKSGSNPSFPSIRYCIANFFNAGLTLSIGMKSLSCRTFFKLEFQTIPELHQPLNNQLPNSFIFRMLLAMSFCFVCNTVVLSSRIGSLRITLLFTDLVVFLGNSNSGIKTGSFTSGWASNLCINSASLSS